MPENELPANVAALANVVVVRVAAGFATWRWGTSFFGKAAAAFSGEPDGRYIRMFGAALNDRMALNRIAEQLSVSTITARTPISGSRQWPTS